MALELSILTLNVWYVSNFNRLIDAHFCNIVIYFGYRGIPFISKDRDIRIKAIGHELEKGKYDIVSLQEVWSESDYQYLKNITSSILPFAHYFYR